MGGADDISARATPFVVVACSPPSSFCCCCCRRHRRSASRRTSLQPGRSTLLSLSRTLLSRVAAIPNTAHAVVLFVFVSLFLARAVDASCSCSTSTSIAMSLSDQQSEGAPVVRLGPEIIKSQNDPRQYRSIVLANNLHAVLISDPNADVVRIIRARASSS